MTAWRRRALRRRAAVAFIAIAALALPAALAGPASARRSSHHCHHHPCGPTSTTARPTTTSSTSSTSTTVLPPASSIPGITIDDTSNLSTLVAGLRAMPRRTTARVVFDENVGASQYTGALTSIDPAADVMGELLDSAYVKQISTSDYITRAQSYLSTLGDKVNIWEVGNEVNGNWLGSYPDVSAKIAGAFRIDHGAGKQTALTLYYNPNGLDGPGELTPVAFTQQYVPADMRAGLNYVLLSYYERDFGGYRPAASTLTALFAQLHALYPNARLGFGEVGLDNPVKAATLNQAASIMAYYYALRIPVPGYIGGGFWWYGAEDVLGARATLTAQFHTAVESMP